MRRVEVAVIWVIIAGTATYLFLVDPTRGGYPSCPFRLLTGFQCPGCGTTRALHQLLHGHPLTAFELNPLIVIALPFLTFILILLTQSAIGKRNNWSISIPARYGWLTLLVVVGFWIVRNTSFYPFTS
jgi:hypothetical protein